MSEVNDRLFELEKENKQLKSMLLFFSNTYCSTIKQNNKLKKEHKALKSYISEYKSKSEKDKLTGLYEKITFKSLVKEYDTENNESYLVVLDIDDFKKVNDTEGHLVGDQMLVTLANIISKSFRNDDLKSRFGGDEFALLLKNTNYTGALKLLERLKNNILVESSLPFTISIGFTKYDSKLSYHKNFANADSALYEVKRNNKNAIYFK